MLFQLYLLSLSVYALFWQCGESTVMVNVVPKMAGFDGPGIRGF